MKLSKHAIARSQQRCIPPEVMELIPKYGTRTYMPYKALGYSVSRKQINNIIRDIKRFIQRLEKCNGITMVVSNDSSKEIITVYHNR